MLEDNTVVGTGAVEFMSSTLRYVTLRYITLRYVTLRYVTLRYFTLRYKLLWARNPTSEREMCILNEVWMEQTLLSAQPLCWVPKTPLLRNFINEFILFDCNLYQPDSPIWRSVSPEPVFVNV